MLLTNFAITLLSILIELWINIIIYNTKFFFVIIYHSFFLNNQLMLDKDLHKGFSYYSTYFD